MTPAGWRVPQREELFPVAAEQSCVLCGSQDWRYVYLLLTAPQWVQALPWVLNWFVALCGPCHEAYQSGDDVALASAYGQSARSAPSPDATALLHVLRARSSEPPVSREQAQRTLQVRCGQRMRRAGVDAVTAGAGSRASQLSPAGVGRR